MAIFNELHPASFRGVPFYFEEDGGVEGGRKTVTHEFPNKDERDIEDLGGFKKIYKITGVVAEPNYRANRDALIAALDQPGIGTLVHPFFGVKQVKLIERYRVTQSMRNIGVARFDMTFGEALADTIYPAQAANNLGQIASLASQVATAASNAMSSVWQVGSSFRANYVSAQASLDQLTNQFNNVIDPFSSTPLATSQYRLDLAQFSAALNQNILNPVNLGNSIQTVFNDMDNITTDARATLNLMQSFFNYGELTTPLIITPQQQQRLDNDAALFSQVGFTALANAYAAATQMIFSDENDLQAAQASLENQFSFCMNITNFDDDTITLLKDLRDQVRLFFDKGVINIKKLIPIVTPTTTITVLTYAYYNSLDNIDTLLDINDVTTPSVISGNFSVVSNL